MMAESLMQTIRDPVLWETPDPVWAPGRGLRTISGAERG